MSIKRDKFNDIVDTMNTLPVEKSKSKRNLQQHIHKFKTFYENSNSKLDFKSDPVILLDVDGVLAAFTQSVIDTLNPKTGKNVTLDYIVNQKIDWALESAWGLSEAEWWKLIDENPNFWRDIKPFSWAKELYETLNGIAAEVIIATSPPKNPIAASHKIEWLEKHIGVTHHNIMIGKKKYLMAKENHILIDDYHRNIAQFEEHGGRGILVPSDWNTKDLSFEKVWEVIKKEL